MEIPFVSTAISSDVPSAIVPILCASSFVLSIMVRDERGIGAGDRGQPARAGYQYADGGDPLDQFPDKPAPRTVLEFSLEFWAERSMPCIHLSISPTSDVIERIVSLMVEVVQLVQVQAT